jgi:hypothetical protein
MDIDGTLMFTGEHQCAIHDVGWVVITLAGG